MHILLLHTRYQAPGGEDCVFDIECDTLRERGHQVSIITESNADYGDVPLVRSMGELVWSRSAERRITDLIGNNRPNVVHIHNTFFRLSPSVYSACDRAGVPIVQTLHNYRWLCPAATLFRDGRRCEECLGKTVPFPSMVHACYRESHIASAGVAAIVGIHRILRTLTKTVDLFISPGAFLRSRYIEGGFPAKKIVVKPHAVRTPGGSVSACDGPVIFVGRLSEEKGIRTLLKAWQGMGGIPLLIVGDGPLRSYVEESIRQMPNVRMLGHRPPVEVAELIRSASLLVAPSTGPESFGLTAIEAFSCGVPVVCSGHGGLGEIVRHGVTGLHCTPGDPIDLAETIKQLFKNRAECRRLGRNGYTEFMEKYSTERNYTQLIEAYNIARQNRNARETS